MEPYVDSWLWLSVSGFDASEVSYIKKKLTVADSSGKSATIYKSYIEKDGMIGIPRSFFKDSSRSKIDKSYKCSDGSQFNSESICANDCELSHVLMRGFSVLIDNICSEKSGDAIAVIGSDLDSIRVLSRISKSIQMRMVVVSPPGVQFESWAEASKSDLSGLSLDKAEEGKDLSDAHVVVVSSDKISSLIDKNVFRPDEFGVVVFLNIAKISLGLFLKMIGFFNCSKRIGIVNPSSPMTGSCERIFKYHLGSPCFFLKTDQDTPKIRRVWSSWKISSWSKVNPVLISKESLLEHMCSSSIYNQHIVEQLVLAMESGRKIILFSDRVFHLRTIKMILESTWSGNPRKIDFMMDGMSPEDILDASKSDVILTTFSFVGEIPDMPMVDTVMIATPVKDPSPFVKVCTSQYPGKKPSVIVDMRCDGIPVCKDYGKMRDDLYLSLFGQVNEQSSIDS